MKDSTDEVSENIMVFLKKNDKEAFTIKELAGQLNVMELDAELCVRELSKHNMVVCSWIKIGKGKTDKELYVTLKNKRKRKLQLDPEPESDPEPPDIMYQ